MRKLDLEEKKINWVDALPRVLNCYHNTRNETGYSPFQLVFGREQNGRGLPLLPPRECESAVAFCERISVMDQVISEKLNSQLAKVAALTNSSRKLRTSFS